MATFNLTIITPEGTIYKNEVESATIPGEEGYFATPPGTKKHLKVNAKRFETLDDLGLFLIKHPDWKVYVGNAQINSGLVVEGVIPLVKLRQA